MSVLFLETKDLHMAGLVAASASLPALLSSFLPAPLSEDDPGVLFLFAHKEPLWCHKMAHNGTSQSRSKGLAGTRHHPPPGDHSFLMTAWPAVPLPCPQVQDSPELSLRWEPLLLPPLSLLPLVEAASLVGICCCTAVCLWIWLVALSSWIGTSLLAGRLSAGALSRRATSERSGNSGPVPDSSTLTRGPGTLTMAVGPSSPSPLKLGGWFGGWA